MRPRVFLLVCLASALIWAALIAGIAHAATYWTLDANCCSIHANAWERGHLNERNLGLGVTVQHDAWGMASGFYDNSFRRISKYLLADWLPIHFGPFRAGITAGAASGYAKSNVASEPWIGGLEVTAKLPADMIGRAIIVPSIGSTVGFAGFQLGLRL